MDTADVNHCSVPAAPALVDTTFPEVFAHEESKQYKEIRRLLETLAALCLSQSAEQLCSQSKYSGIAKSRNRSNKNSGKSFERCINPRKVFGRKHATLVKTRG